MPITLIGRPAKPFPPAVVTAVTEAVRSVDGIAEAHFPQMFIASQMPAPEQTLIVVLGAGRDEGAVMRAVMAAIKQRLPSGPDLLAMPMIGSDSRLATVRGSGCELFRSPTEKPADRPWWRFW